MPDKVRKLAVYRHSMPRLFGKVLRVRNRAVDRIIAFPAAETHPFHGSVRSIACQSGVECGVIAKAAGSLSMCLTCDSKAVKTGKVHERDRHCRAT